MTADPEELRASAVSCYARYRPGYPIGPSGFPGVPPGAAIAVDALPGMLGVARAAAERTGVAHVEWRQADASRFRRNRAGCAPSRRHTRGTWAHGASPATFSAYRRRVPRTWTSCVRRRSSGWRG